MIDWNLKNPMPVTSVSADEIIEECDGLLDYLEVLSFGGDEGKAYRRALLQRLKDLINEMERRRRTGWAIAYSHGAKVPESGDHHRRAAPPQGVEHGDVAARLQWRDW